MCYRAALGEPVLNTYYFFFQSFLIHITVVYVHVTTIFRRSDHMTSDKDEQQRILRNLKKTELLELLIEENNENERLYKLLQEHGIGDASEEAAESPDALIGTPAETEVQPAEQEEADGGQPEDKKEKKKKKKKESPYRFNWYSKFLIFHYLKQITACCICEKSSSRSNLTVIRHKKIFESKIFFNLCRCIFCIDPVF